MQYIACPIIGIVRSLVVTWKVGKLEIQCNRKARAELILSIRDDNNNRCTVHYAVQIANEAILTRRSRAVLLSFESKTKPLVMIVIGTSILSAIYEHTSYFLDSS